MTWDDFKVFLNIASNSYFLEEGTDYYIWTVLAGKKIEFSISKVDTDDSIIKSDFEANYKLKLNKQEVIVPSLGNYKGKIFHQKGYKAVCPPGQTTLLDIPIAQGSLIFGGIYSVLESEIAIGDLISIIYCVDIGQQIIEVGDFAETIFVKFFPKGEIKRIDTAEPISSPNIVLRVKYENTSDTVINFGFILEVW